MIVNNVNNVNNKNMKADFLSLFFVATNELCDVKSENAEEEPAER